MQLRTQNYMYTYKLLSNLRTFLYFSMEKQGLRQFLYILDSPLLCKIINHQKPEQLAYYKSYQMNLDSELDGSIWNVTDVMEVQTSLLFQINLSSLVSKDIFQWQILSRNIPISVHFIEVIIIYIKLGISHSLISSFSLSFAIYVLSSSIPVEYYVAAVDLDYIF